MGPPTVSSMEGFADVEVRRSRRRRKTVSAYRDGDRLVLLVPAGLSARAEERYARELGAKVLAREQRRRPSDSDLVERASRLSERYLEGRAVPASVRWVTNQSTRWGSCTVSDRTIRLSHRLRGMPDYVVDYVLLHELVHLLVPGHGPDFHALMDRYPRCERARGYLEGWSGRDVPLDDGEELAAEPSDEPDDVAEGDGGVTAAR